AALARRGRLTRTIPFPPRRVAVAGRPGGPGVSVARARVRAGRTGLVALAGRRRLVLGGGRGREQEERHQGFHQRVPSSCSSFCQQSSSALPTRTSAAQGSRWMRKKTDVVDSDGSGALTPTSAGLRRLWAKTPPRRDAAAAM